MKFADVNACFTEIVARYMADGWHINAGSMDGSQGEMAKIDLTDGTRLVRVLMTRDMDSRIFDNVVRVMVGYADPKAKFDVDVRTHNIVWNERLDIVEMHRFVEFRDDVYMELTNNEIDKIRDIRKKRFAQRYCVDSLSVSRDITNDHVKSIVVPAVRRRIGFKTVKPSDIEVVILNRRNGRHEYDVHVRGKRVTL